MARTNDPHSATAQFFINASNNDFEFSDPGLAYDTLSWSMLYTTQLLLVNFPEKNGQAGSQLYPEGATAFPTVVRSSPPLPTGNAAERVVSKIR